MTFAATIFTLYPEMFPGPFGASLAGKALGLNVDKRAKEGVNWTI